MKRNAQPPTKRYFVWHLNNAEKKSWQVCSGGHGGYGGYGKQCKKVPEQRGQQVPVQQPVTECVQVPRENCKQVGRHQTPLTTLCLLTPLQVPVQKPVQKCNQVPKENCQQVHTECRIQNVVLHISCQVPVQSCDQVPVKKPTKVAKQVCDSGRPRGGYHG